MAERYVGPGEAKDAAYLRAVKRVAITNMVVFACLVSLRCLRTWYIGRLTAFYDVVLIVWCLLSVLLIGAAAHAKVDRRLGLPIWVWVWLTICALGILSLGTAIIFRS